MTLRRVRPPRARLVLLVLGVVAGALALSGCGSNVDLKQAIKITDLSGGYFDAGIKDGKNRLLPSVSFKVTKSIEDDIRPLSLNFAFKRIAGQTEQEFDDVFVQSVSFSEGNQTPEMTVRTEAGYTGDAPQSRAEMLENKEFLDMRVVIFAKHSSSNWVEVARYDLPRLLITK